MQRRNNVSTPTYFFFTTSGGIHFLSFALVWVGKPFFCSHPTNQHQPSINQSCSHPSIHCNFDAIIENNTISIPLPNF